MTTFQQRTWEVVEDKAGNPEFENKVLEIIKEFTDRGYSATRTMMIYRLFKRIVNPAALANDTDDRQIRRAIENLRQRGYPIVSTSGDKGYTLVTDRAEIEKMIAELESRRERMADQIRALRNTNKIHEISTAPQLVQEELFK